MAPRVSISAKAARAALDALTGEFPGGAWPRAVEELRTALAPRPKKALPFKSRKQEKAKKDRAKKAATKDVRMAVMVRARGRCECGCGEFATEADPLELDHFRGRARAESVESCWALKASHHRQKTRSEPSAAEWLCRFINHAKAHGYDGEARLARNRAAFVALRGASHVG